MNDMHFRAWDKAKGKWIDGAYGFHILGEAMLIGGLFQDYKIEDLNNIVIEQFTGLFDKQGKEIYEGDIVRYTHKDLGHPVDYEVVFYEGAFLQENCPPRRLYKPNIWYEWEKLQVIGTIHENPKLLETERK